MSRRKRSNAFCDAMAGEAIEALVEAGGDAETIAIERRVEMRYVGQGFEIDVAVPDGVLGADLGEVLHEGFLDRYDELFGRRITGVPVETVTWRMSASGPTPNVVLNFEGQRLDTGPAEKGERQVYFPETGCAPCKVYNRYALSPVANSAVPPSSRSGSRPSLPAPIPPCRSTDT